MSHAGGQSNAVSEHGGEDFSASASQEAPARVHAPKAAPRWRPCSTPPTREGIYHCRYADLRGFSLFYNEMFRGVWVHRDSAEGKHHYDASPCDGWEWLDDQGAAHAVENGRIDWKCPHCSVGCVACISKTAQAQGYHQRESAAQPLGKSAIGNAVVNCAGKQADAGTTAQTDPHPLGTRALEAAMAFRPEGKLFGSRSSE